MNREGYHVRVAYLYVGCVWLIFWTDVKRSECLERKTCSFTSGAAAGWYISSLAITKLTPSLVVQLWWWVWAWHHEEEAFFSAPYAQVHFLYSDSYGYPTFPNVTSSIQIIVAAPCTCCQARICFLPESAQALVCHQNKVVSIPLSLSLVVMSFAC